MSTHVSTRAQKYGHRCITHMYMHLHMVDLLAHTYVCACTLVNVVCVCV